ncbi:RNA polymerase sigma factor [Aquimarina sp. 2201CG14-23]|uniref:RNA polymerase sigma factor n=1 Tax=Aquimarina mycalae TaxID=3040073 RepID=UPI00247807F2|nr:sigma-70 family RNA polymerase sigma factor [Aquimarina sp. 2201CG14-23]MDH7447667.1 sigma-70 family RNA polymerase sigma factor [Aquimarina sp. 2201CG14-23]
MSNNEQNEIITGIVAGNQTIITAFYKKHLPQVKSFILKNSGSEKDAEDVFQDAMVFVYEKLENNSLQLTSSLGTYIYSVCRNMWMNKLRKSKKEIQHEGVLSVVASDTGNIVDEIEKKERRYIYQKCFLKLGPACQELLTLFFNGLSMKDIAKQRNSTESYVRKKKFDCKKRLTQLVKADPIYEELKMDTN